MRTFFKSLGEHRQFILPVPPYAGGTCVALDGNYCREGNRGEHRNAVFVSPDGKGATLIRVNPEQMVEVLEPIEPEEFLERFEIPAAASRPALPEPVAV